MAIDPNALFLQIDSVYDAASLGLMARDVIGEGVTTSGGLVVSERGSGANMSVDIAAGVCWVQGDEDAAQPTYRVAAGSLTNVAVTSAHASLGRIDLVIVRVADSQFSGTADEATLEVVAGTPASSPAAPSLPDNAIALAQVAVAAQATEVLDQDITDLRQPWAPDRSRTGELVAMATAAPWGTLVCDGTSFSSARYPRLAAALGGTTLPDWRGRALIGAGQGDGLSARTLGQVLGVESVVLSALQSGVQAHGHAKGTLAVGGQINVNPSYAAATFPSGSGWSAIGVAAGTGNAAGPSGGVTGLAAVWYHEHSLNGNIADAVAANAQAAHTNMPPSHVATPCIRV